MKKKLIGIILSAVLALTLGLTMAGPAGAATYQIQVSQETSPGSGVFTILGTVDIFDESGSTAAEVYDYVPTPPDPVPADLCPVSYRGTVVDALVDTAQIFFVNTSEGLVLFVLYDDKNDDLGDCACCAGTGDTTGGWAQMRFDLDTVTPDYLVKDDPLPYDIYNSYFGVDGYAKNMVTVHTWDPPRTDGVGIGPLECPWVIDVRFMPGAEGGIFGITNWQVTDSEGNDIDLALQLNRKVRFECVETSDIVVPIDIKPTSCPNPINLNSKGVLPVAILGSEDLDVSEIDPESINLAYFGPGSDPFEPIIPPDKTSIEDVATPYGGDLINCLSCWTEGPDGFLDLTMKFSTQDIAGAIADYVVDGDCLLLVFTGSLYDGTPFTGSDIVKIIKKVPNDNHNGQATASNNGNGKSKGK